MRLKIKTDLTKEQFRARKCCLGLDEVAFTEQYGWRTEFLGHLKPLAILSDDEYVFYLEKITRDEKCQSMRVLDETKPDERQLIKQALIHDYSLKEDEIVL